MRIVKSELRDPVNQGLLLGISDLLLGRKKVREVIILRLQAKCGEAPACIFSGEDPIWPLGPIELAVFGHEEHLAVDGPE